MAFTALKRKLGCGIVFLLLSLLGNFSKSVLLPHDNGWVIAQGVMQPWPGGARLESGTLVVSCSCYKRILLLLSGV